MPSIRTLPIPHLPVVVALAIAAVLSAMGAWADEPLQLDPAISAPTWIPVLLARRNPTPLLPSNAFTPMPACGVDPFADVQPDDFGRALDQTCGQDQFRVRVDASRARDIDSGPSRYQLEVDQVLTRRLDALTTTARLGWEGYGDEQQRGGTLQTGRALMAAGANYRLDDAIAFDLNIGRARDGGPIARNRATVSSTWRPADDHLLFLEWATEATGVANVVGYRWWVIPRRISLEMTARVPADRQQGVQPSLGLSVFDWGR